MAEKLCVNSSPEKDALHLVKEIRLADGKRSSVAHSSSERRCILNYLFLAVKKVL